MSSPKSTSLVPVRPRLPVPVAAPRGKPVGFDLVAEETVLADRAAVERLLPDIMGRALARAWIDAEFRADLMRNPKAVLAEHRLHLPANILLEVTRPDGSRPVAVVSEVEGGRSRRILFLKLVMVAGR